MPSSNPLPPGIRHVAVMAPASPVKPEKLKAALALARGWGIRITVLPSVTAAASDAGGRSSDMALRRKDFNACLRDESVDLLWCARGGYGSVQLLDQVDWRRLARRHLPVLGYSDITGLLLAMRAKQAGVPIAGPIFTDLPRLLREPWSLASFRRAMAPQPEPEAVGRPPRGPSLRVLRDGAAAGPLIPANLALLCSLLGTPYLPDLRGAILLLEDINEPPYRLDRQLTQLVQAGILGGCAGLLFGNFRQCGSAAAQRKLFAKFATAVRGPVLAGFPCGHTWPRLTLPVGRRAQILRGGKVRLG